MDGSHVFLSYSHKQAYFAEALMLSLEQAGIPVWFDLQRLPPGIAWKRAINDGLSSCNGLVLVASQASIRSDAVRVEWETVLAAGKPVYVVLFEAVHLPQALRVATRIDMRWAFRKKVLMLAEVIRTGKVRRDRLVRPNPLRLPTRLPSSLWFIIVSLWLIGLTSLLFSWVLLRLCQALVANVFPVDIHPPEFHADDARLGFLGVTFHGDGPTVLLVLILTVALWLATLLTLYVAVALLYRWRFDFVLFRAVLLMAPGYVFVAGAVLFVLSGWVQDLGPNLPLLPLGAQTASFMAAFWDLGMASAILTLAALATYLLSRRSGALLRWLPTGSAPAVLRLHANPKDIRLNRPKMVPEVKQTRWRLWYEPANERLARYVRATLRRELFVQESAVGAATLNIALVSNQTQQAWLDELSQRLPGLVCLVSTSLRVPATLVHVHQTQWLDYRQRSGFQVADMMHRVQVDPLTNVYYGFPAVPEVLDRNAAPRRVQQFAATIRLLAFFSLGAVLFVFFGITASTPLILSSVGLLALAPSVYVGWLADRVLACDITVSAWTGRYFIASLLLILGQLQFYATHGLSIGWVPAIIAFVIFDVAFIGIGNYVLRNGVGDVVEQSHRHPTQVEDEDYPTWLPSTTARPFRAHGTLAIPLRYRIGTAVPTFLLIVIGLAFIAGLLMVLVVP